MMVAELKNIISEKAVFIVLLYLLIVGILGVGLTCADKRRARLHKWRIPERTLLFVSLLGGAVPMLCTMKAIRHKTNHKKFMIGIPLIICLHICLIFLLFWRLTKG